MSAGQESKTCFVVSEIGEESTETRIRADQVLKHIIEPIANECGYRDVVRADDIARPGMITPDIIGHLYDDPLRVADVTGRNPNVYYEVAVRQAVRRPLVMLIKSGERLPFDVADSRTIQFDHHDLDSVARCTS